MPTAEQECDLGMAKLRQQTPDGGSSCIEAAKYFERAAELDPTNVTYMTNAGVAYQLAIQRWHFHIGTGPLVSIALFNAKTALGQKIHREHGVLDGVTDANLEHLWTLADKALRWYAKGIEADPGKQTARAWRAQLYRNLGMFGPALRDCETILADTRADADLRKTASGVKDYIEGAASELRAYLTPDKARRLAAPTGIAIDGTEKRPGLETGSPVPATELQEAPAHVIRCPSCNAKLRAPADRKHKNVRCPKCKTVFVRTDRVDRSGYTTDGPPDVETDTGPQSGAVPDDSSQRGREAMSHLLQSRRIGTIVVVGLLTLGGLIAVAWRLAPRRITPLVPTIQESNAQLDSGAPSTKLETYAKATRGDWPQTAPAPQGNSVFAADPPFESIPKPHAREARGESVPTRGNALTPRSTRRRDSEKGANPSTARPLFTFPDRTIPSWLVCENRVAYIEVQSKSSSDFSNLPENKTFWAPAGKEWLIWHVCLPSQRLSSIVSPTAFEITGTDGASYHASYVSMLNYTVFTSGGINSSSFFSDAQELSDTQLEIKGLFKLSFVNAGQHRQTLDLPRAARSDVRVACLVPTGWRADALRYSGKTYSVRANKSTEGVPRRQRTGVQLVAADSNAASRVNLRLRRSGKGLPACTGRVLITRSSEKAKPMPPSGFPIVSIEWNIPEVLVMNESSYRFFESTNRFARPMPVPLLESTLTNSRGGPMTICREPDGTTLGRVVSDADIGNSSIVQLARPVVFGWVIYRPGEYRVLFDGSTTPLSFKIVAD